MSVQADRLDRAVSRPAAPVPSPFPSAVSSRIVSDRRVARAVAGRIPVIV
ncbi:hypothetical protein [Sphingomonas pseudosanguinis]|uniref:Uncharacterized protein n=1 Tax=Sphingomonas pseudosanguinis TaxID=413712 RepID=A0A7W6ACT0_9SPHN|nr:hypothetical protein [Sphingomonas pseudosanguinis]MBB3880415.1 hypothetical protein [Sphingomonas pseudosanguinis]MBN3535626.1 hypothetical protein [Sphingomonas pseudosanguinis]